MASLYACGISHELCFVSVLYLLQVVNESRLKVAKVLPVFPTALCGVLFPWLI